MAEYDRMQKKQESRAVANNCIGSKQLNGNINNSLLPGKYKLVNPSLNINNVSQLVHASFLPASYANANAVALPAGAAGIAAAAGHPGILLHSDKLRASLTMPVVPAAIGHGPGAGVPDSNIDFNPIPNQAHHIVEAAGGGASGVAARALLVAAGIDIDSSCNGVLLPSVHHDDAGDATVHLGNHKNEYMVCVNASLGRAIDAAVPPIPILFPGATPQIKVRGAIAAAIPLPPPLSAWLQGVIVARLNSIRNMLLTENVPINQDVDGDWNPLTGAPITITEVFANYGL